MKMTEEEIITATKCCASSDKEACDKCPCSKKYNITDGDKCIPFLMENFLELLEHKNAETGRLQKLLDDKCDRCIERERAKAVKEVVNRLQKRILSQLGCSTIEKKEAYYFCLDEIDNIKKERVGENNE